MGKLEGKVAIVTGAGAGIGKGIAKVFAREGARVTVAEYNAESGQQTASEIEQEGGQALFVQVDVGNKDQVLSMVSQTIETWGRVDILINNAWSSRAPLARVEWFDDTTLQSAFEVGTMGAFWAMQACYPYMKEQAYGRVVNMCSLNGVNAHMYSMHYNMAKEALRAITRTAAVEWASKGINCNVICPAAKTEALSKFEAAAPDNVKALKNAIPMKYFGDPELDIAPVALFLSTEESRYVTGNTLFVDGGSHVNGSPWAPELPEEL
ncbi:MAG: SDR family oxidoreductase [Pseudomonadales bacterium]